MNFHPSLLCLPTVLLSLNIAALAHAQDQDSPESTPSKAATTKVSPLAGMIQSLNQAKNNPQNTATKPENHEADQKAKHYIDTVQRYYDNARSYSASFSQEYQSVDGIKKSSEGTVWFQKPSKMRWDYSSPEARYLISDGQFFWSWEPTYRQYCRQDLKKSQLPTALTFLAGDGRLEDDFHISLIKEQDQRVELKLLPKESSISYSEIRFELLMPEARVYRVTILDAMGNKNRLTFKKPELNADLDPKAFQFSPPADANQLCE